MSDLERGEQSPSRHRPTSTRNLDIQIPHASNTEQEDEERRDRFGDDYHSHQAYPNTPLGRSLSTTHARKSPTGSFFGFSGIRNFFNGAGSGTGGGNASRTYAPSSSSSYNQGRMSSPQDSPTRILHTSSSGSSGGGGIVRQQSLISTSPYAKISPMPPTTSTTTNTNLNTASSVANSNTSGKNSPLAHQNSAKIKPSPLSQQIKQKSSASLFSSGTGPLNRHHNMAILRRTFRPSATVLGSRWSKFDRGSVGGQSTAAPSGDKPVVTSITSGSSSNQTTINGDKTKLPLHHDPNSQSVTNMTTQHQAHPHCKVVQTVTNSLKHVETFKEYFTLWYSEILNSNPHYYAFRLTEFNIIPFTLFNIMLTAYFIFIIIFTLAYFPLNHKNNDHDSDRDYRQHDLTGNILEYLSLIICFMCIILGWLCNYLIYWKEKLLIASIQAQPCLTDNNPQQQDGGQGMDGNGNGMGSNGDGNNDKAQQQARIGFEQRFRNGNTGGPTNDQQHMEPNMEYPDQSMVPPLEENARHHHQLQLLADHEIYHVWSNRVEYCWVFLATLSINIWVLFLAYEGNMIRQRSNYAAAVGRMPEVSTLISMMVPELAFFIVKSVTLRNAVFFMLFSMIFNFVVAISLNLTNSLPTLCCYSLIAIFLLLEFYRQDWSSYLLTDTLQSLIVQNEKMSEEITSNELRHMLGNITHDLKTPLSSIINGAEVIGNIARDIRSSYNGNTPYNMSGKVTDSILTQLANSSQKNNTSSSTPLSEQDLLEKIDTILEITEDVSNSNHFMMMTINRCIDYSKTIHGFKLMPRADHVHIQEAINFPLNCLRNLVHGSLPILIEPLPYELTHHMVVTDKQWLFENLLCLVSNAVKYSAKGNIVVHVGLIIIGNNGVITPAGTPANATKDVHPEKRKFQTLHKHEEGDEGHSISTPIGPASPSGALSPAGLASPNGALSPASPSSPTNASVEENSNNGSNDTAQVPAPVTKSPPPRLKRGLSSMKPKDFNNMYIQFEIEDTGPGVISDDNSIFMEPSQAARLTGGTGLGLFSLAKRVETLEGKYGVRSRSDGEQGSCFWFTIPYRPVMNTTTTAAAMTIAMARHEKLRKEKEREKEREREKEKERENETIGVSNSTLFIQQQHEFAPSGKVGSCYVPSPAAAAEIVAKAKELSPNNSTIVPARIESGVTTTTSFDSTTASVDGTVPATASNTTPVVPAITEKSSNADTDLAAASKDSLASATTTASKSVSNALMNRTTSVPPSISSSKSSIVTATTGGNGEFNLSRPLTILLVEDSVVISKMVHMLLKRHGHTVIVLENGLDAVNYVRTHSHPDDPSASSNITPLLTNGVEDRTIEQQQIQTNSNLLAGGYENCVDVILMDFQMPIMSGIEAIRLIREFECECLEVDFKDCSPFRPTDLNNDAVPERRPSKAIHSSPSFRQAYGMLLPSSSSLYSSEMSLSLSVSIPRSISVQSRSYYGSMMGNNPGNSLSTNALNVGGGNTSSIHSIQSRKASDGSILSNISGSIHSSNGENSITSTSQQTTITTTTPTLSQPLVFNNNCLPLNSLPENQEVEEEGNNSTKLPTVNTTTTTTAAMNGNTKLAPIIRGNSNLTYTAKPGSVMSPSSLSPTTPLSPIASQSASSNALVKRMPSMSKLQQNMKLAEKAKQFIKIIGFSAKSDQIAIREAYALGMDAFISKPFVLKQFYETFMQLSGNNEHGF